MIKEEGGAKYTHDKPDPPTKYGVTLWALRDAWPTIPVTAATVQALTEEQAREIYRSKYWNLSRCDELPAGVDLMMFDFAVNPGPTAAAFALQEAAGVRLDGKIGAVTLAAIQAQDPMMVIQKLATARLRYWLSRDNATEEKYEKGWLARMVRCVMTAEAMVAHLDPSRLAPLLPRA